MKTVSLVVCAALFAISFTTFAADRRGAEKVHGSETTISYIAGETDKASSVALALAPIRSASQLRSYIASTPADLSPLFYTTPQERNAFVASLRFGRNGLIDFNYMPLKQLRAAQVYQLLSLFGLQSTSYLVGSTAADAVDQEINTPMLRADFEIDSYCDGNVCSRSIGKACVTQNCTSL